MKNCFFENLYKCSRQCVLSRAGLHRIRKASNQHGDGLCEGLVDQQDDQTTVAVHRKCVDRYCHPKSINKSLKERGDLSESPNNNDECTPPAAKRSRRSEHCKFIASEHCIFCGLSCEIKKDPKNPSRWRPAYLCREIDVPGRRNLKKEIMKMCERRQDNHAEQISVRVAGIPADLHAANVRYHVDCKVRFMASKSVQYAQAAAEQEGSNDLAFLAVVESYKNKKSEIVNSVDIHKEYKEEGGELSRRQLTEKLVEHFKGDLIALSSPGMATILAFQSTTAKLLHMVPDKEADDTEEAIKKVAKKIIDDIKEMPANRELYQCKLTMESCSQFQSDTLAKLLSAVNKKMNHQSLPSLLIGNIVTAISKNLATPIQLGLAILLRDSKEHVRALSDFGVCCSYDELLRFKKSVAKVAYKAMDLAGLQDASHGLVQSVGDNFDQEIFSQNGKLQTHSMALLLTQVENSKRDDEITIPRLPKSEMSKEVPYHLQVSRYTGVKKPTPPENSMIIKVPTLADLARTAIRVHKARKKDLAFLKDVLHENAPEYHGYNTQKTREEDKSLQSRTKAILSTIDRYASCRVRHDIDIHAEGETDV